MLAKKLGAKTCVICKTDLRLTGKCCEKCHELVPYCAGCDKNALECNGMMNHKDLQSTEKYCASCDMKGHVITDHNNNPDINAALAELQSTEPIGVVAELEDITKNLHIGKTIRKDQFMDYLKKHGVDIPEDKILNLLDILNQGRKLWFSERLVLKHMINFIFEGIKKEGVTNS